MAKIMNIKPMIPKTDKTISIMYIVFEASVSVAANGWYLVVSAIDVALAVVK